MCLNNITTTRPFIAEEDIVCYKAIRMSIDFKDGDSVEAEIEGEKIEGIIIEFYFGIKLMYAILHNSKTANSMKNVDSLKYNAPNYKSSYLDYKYIIVQNNLIKILKINNSKNFKCEFFTPFRNCEISLNKEYVSELCLTPCTDANGSCFNIVNKGLHSMDSINDTLIVIDLAMTNRYSIIAKCIIPKGSEYYVGTFNESKSYASNKLIYKEFIHLSDERIRSSIPNK